MTDAGLKSVSPTEAAKLQKSGWTLVDVRGEKEYLKQHAEDAVNVSLFRPVMGDSGWDRAKRFVMATAFAMEATERNPEFKSDALKRLKKNQKVIVVCGIGELLP